LTPQQLKERMTQMKVAPKKALGQNFLINSHVIQKIVASATGQEYSAVLEVGPGLGALTEALLTAGVRPRLIELDSEFAQYWRGRELEVLEGDALQLNWNDLQLPDNTLLVSNLPYQISTSLVIERCLGPEQIHRMVLMFQKEVAQRLCAEPRTKEYGFLSVMAQLHYRMRKVADAAPMDFFPAPKVASRVLAFERRSPSLGPQFLRFAKAAFAFRRKFMLKNLGAVVNKAQQARLPEMMKAVGLSEKARAEELTPPQFVELFKQVYEH
jgi:16S rRNA (adenine1518-N6/adenine1519-N6)-dimethyltransferase